MSALTEFLATADLEARALLGTFATFSVGPVVYGRAEVILAPARFEQAFESGGAEVHVKFTATVRKDAMTRVPEEGHAVTVAGRRYYVVGTSTTPADPLLTLTLAN